ncbi:NAD(P)/FAD-dependent oxidoreductase [Pontivivens ytuae]|uniref:NAD(P)-binding protein n=1 Tax=Pontivivens ytuae TaxID=2789856 RepID=A0A7S9LUK9_9RHOB|nr:NAD(P)-binding protein [Pontivivens ytuae]QPH55529.1 NAD(P)-binding protein [Pontivivens ytuae]
MDVAVIGAGLAGLTCARALVDAGLVVEVFDKGRGPGGRIATRRSDFGAYDHGAPVLHDLPECMAASADRVLAPWEDGHIGVPSMSRLPRHLSTGLTVHQGEKLDALTPGEGRWSLAFDGARGLIRARTVLLCLPAPQAQALLPGTLLPEVAQARMSPLWTLMAAFDQRVEAADRLEFDAGHVALRQSARPERENAADLWVIHGGAEWSRGTVDRPREEVQGALLDAFLALTGAVLPVETMIHRWLYARTRTAAGLPCLYDADHRIGAAGDWCLGPNAGDAVRSGAALADAVLAS